MRHYFYIRYIYRNTIFLTNHKLSSDFKKEILNIGVLDKQAHHFLHAHMKKSEKLLNTFMKVGKKMNLHIMLLFYFYWFIALKMKKKIIWLPHQHWKMFLVLFQTKWYFFLEFFKSKLVFEKDNNQAMSKSRKLDTKTKAQSTVKHAWKKKLLTHFVFFKTELNLGQICG